MTRFSRMVSVVPALVVASIVLTPARASAQAAGVAPSTDHQQLISANPFGLIIQLLNVAYDRRVSPSVTVGVSVSRLALADWDGPYASGAGVVRYYPAGSALRGFYLGGRGGVYHFSDSADSRTVFGAGFEIGYDWLLGPKQNIGLSLGVGATRLFAGEFDDVPIVIPTLRLLNVGIAF